MGKMKKLHQRLYAAIQDGDTDESLAVIRKICKYKGSKVESNRNFLDEYSHLPYEFKPLIHSILKENAIVAIDLLEKGCDPNIDDYVPVAGLKHPNRDCVWFINLIGKPMFKEVVFTILDATTNIIFDDKGNTVLHAICKQRLTSWLQILLELPSKSNLFSEFNNFGYLPMHIAAEFNFLDYFYLVNHSVSVVPFSIMSRLDYKKTMVLFQNCAVRDCSNAVNSFHNEDKSLSAEFNCETDINARVSSGSSTTALHLAAQGMHPELVKCLLERGADVLALEMRFHDPLFAVLDSMIRYIGVEEVNQEQFVDVCRLLIEAGATVNMYYCYNAPVHPAIRQTVYPHDDYLVTPLHVAAQIDCPAVVQLLLQHGADPTLVSKGLGKLPVQFALERGSTECVHLLLSPSLYPDQFLSTFTDKRSNSLLHSAGRCSKSIAAELARICGSMSGKPNVDNVFPLDKAIYYGNVAMIREILSCQPDVVNICYSQRCHVSPALYRAASSPLGHLPLCRILLSYGADIYTKAFKKQKKVVWKAFQSNCFKNAVYLCEQMSHPFTPVEKELMMSTMEEQSDEELRLRVRQRLETIPSLWSHCLDAVRRALIDNCNSFKHADSLPIPKKMIKALKYDDDDYCDNYSNDNDDC